MSNVKVKATKKPVKPVIVVVYILLVILAVVYLAPLLWMLSVSLKDNAGVMSAPFSLPDVFHFENYQQAWQMGKLGTALVNSVLVCGVTLIISLFSALWPLSPSPECAGNYQNLCTPSSSSE